MRYDTHDVKTTMMMTTRRPTVISHYYTINGGDTQSFDCIVSVRGVFVVVIVVVVVFIWGIIAIEKTAHHHLKTKVEHTTNARDTHFSFYHIRSTHYCL